MQGETQNVEGAMSAVVLEFPVIERDERVFSCWCGNSEFEARTFNAPEIQSLVCKACAHVHKLKEGFVDE